MGGQSWPHGEDEIWAITWRKWERRVGQDVYRRGAARAKSLKQGCLGSSKKESSGAEAKQPWRREVEMEATSCSILQAIINTLALTLGTMRRHWRVLNRWMTLSDFHCKRSCSHYHGLRNKPPQILVTQNNLLLFLMVLWIDWAQLGSSSLKSPVRWQVMLAVDWVLSSGIGWNSLIKVGFLKHGRWGSIAKASVPRGQVEAVRILMNQPWKSQNVTFASFYCSSKSQRLAQIL